MLLVGLALGDHEVSSIPRTVTDCAADGLEAGRRGAAPREGAACGRDSASGHPAMPFTELGSPTAATSPPKKTPAGRRRLPPRRSAGRRRGSPPTVKAQRLVGGAHRRRQARRFRALHLKAVALVAGQHEQVERGRSGFSNGSTAPRGRRADGRPGRPRNPPTTRRPWGARRRPRGWRGQSSAWEKAGIFNVDPRRAHLALAHVLVPRLQLARHEDGRKQVQ